MYPTIYDLVKDIFGWNIPFLKILQSFGFMVALSYLLCAWLFSKELKRKEQLGLLSSSTKKVMRGKKTGPGEFALSAIIGFVIFYKLVYMVMNFSAFQNDTQGFLLSMDGNIAGGLAGAIVSAYLKYRENEKERKLFPELKEVTVTVHPHEHVGNMTLIAAGAGLLGAKIFHNLENWDTFVSDPWGSIFSFSGLTMYGGLIVGGLGVVWYAHKQGIKIPHLIDACAPGLMLAYGTGRIGCHLAGDGDWGIVNTHDKPFAWLPDWAWSYTYPHNVNNAGIEIPGCHGPHCHILPFGVYPTPVYEAAIGIILFFLLWNIRKKIVAPGMLFSIYLILNGIERFFIEKIRVNEVYHIFGVTMTQAEIISVLLFLLGVAGIFYFRKRHLQQAG